MKPSSSLLALLGLTLLPAVEAQAQSDADCASLLDHRIDGVNLEITASTWYADRSLPGPAPGAPATPLPPHCRVEGMIDRRSGVDGKQYGIGFALNLPADWNGRFLFQGGGGLNGSINEPVGSQATGGRSALQRGFAVVSTDSGHQGQGAFDASFMEDQEAVLNFFYRAIGKVDDVARNITARHYGEEPRTSYFVGCSTGGREGMIMSQRYPFRFDGIVSGAPAMRTGLSNLADRWVAVKLNQVAPKDANGLPRPGGPFTQAEQELIVDGLLAACDALDGARDGLIFNTRDCDFNPHALVCESEGQDAAACLSTQQADALQTAFAGPVDSRGVQVYPGFLFDPGIDDTGFIPGLIAGSANPVGPPNSEALEQDVDAEFIAATRQDAALGDSTLLNLSSFSGQGGKLIFYHGASDPWFSALDTVGYYERMAERNGGLQTVDDWSRAFLVPGMGHCQGGDDTLDNFDMLSAIVDWVENGEAPARVEATGVSMPGISRPLCPYPSHAHYQGSGDRDDAANYECRE